LPGEFSKKLKNSKTVLLKIFWNGVLEGIKFLFQREIMSCDCLKYKKKIVSGFRRSKKYLP